MTHSGHPHGGDGPDTAGAHLLEQRVAELERQVTALAAAVDAASRMQVATPRRVDQDIRLVGGRLVRRILEKARLVEDHRMSRRAG